MLAECEEGAKRGTGCVVIVFDILDLWPGERRRSGSEASTARRRRLGEEGEKSVSCAATSTCSRGRYA